MTVFTEAARVLLVEDNPADVRLFKEALRQRNIEIDLETASDGEAALAFLDECRDGVERQVPDLVVLDLNLPGIDGREVLEKVKQDPVLRRVPVLIMSTSSSDDDIRACYERHANGYLTKPIGVPALSDALERIFDFWFNTAKLSTRTASRVGS